jgi:hypothetical protein
MATYCFKGKGPALPYDSMFAVLRRSINLATLISTDYGKLALASAPTVSLSSFTGFVQNDILEIFEVPAGTLIVGAGVNVLTAEGATAAATMGYNSATQTQLGVAGAATDPNAYGTFDLNSETCQHEGAVAAGGAFGGFADCYVTDGSIDMTFTTNDTYAVAAFNVWAVVARAFEPVTSQ